MYSFTHIATFILAAIAATDSVMAVPASPVSDLATSDLVSPAKTETSKILAQAKALGVDLNGPIPDDYTSYDEVTGSYYFEDGSKASAWVSGTIALGHVEEPALDKRQSPALGLGLWVNPGCSGTGWWVPNAVYGVSYVATYWNFSLQFSRWLASNEQVDWSYGSGGNWCSTWRFLSNSGTVPQCYNSNVALTCVRFWHW